MENKDIYKLASDYLEQKVFTSFQIPKGSGLLGQIFMPIMFMDEKQTEELKDVGMIYSYFDERGSMQINGYPIFSSFRTLNKSDLMKFKNYVNAIIEKRKNEFELIAQDEIDQLEGMLK